MIRTLIACAFALTLAGCSGQPADVAQPDTQALTQEVAVDLGSPIEDRFHVVLAAGDIDFVVSGTGQAKIEVRVGSTLTILPVDGFTESEAVETAVRAWVDAQES